MRTMLRKLWRDEAGFIISSELILVATILVIGMIVGLASVRDSVVGELADVAEAIGAINQSYSFHGLIGHGNIVTAGSTFIDAPDFCEHTDGVFLKCIVINPPVPCETGTGGT